MRNCSIDSLTGNLKIYPTEEYETGHAIVTIAAKDRLNQADTLHIHLNVEPVNDAPSLTTVQVISFNSDSSRQSPAAVITFKIHANDPESDSITRNVSGSNCLVDLISETCQLRYNIIPTFDDTLFLTIADQEKASRSYYLIVNFKSRYISVIPFQSPVKIEKYTPFRNLGIQSGGKQNRIVFDLAGRRVSLETQTRYSYNRAPGIQVLRNEQQCKYQKRINGIATQKE